MKELEQKYFDSRESFRDWLKNNHDKSPGIWMIFYKKTTKIKCITYREALEEALCFGWIDSILKRLDDTRYLRKFTPRKDISKWSDTNKKLVLSLIENGKMTEAGLKKIDNYLKNGKIDWKNKEPIRDMEKDLEIPDYILEMFGENQPALTNFNSLAKTYKRHYVLWITSAKKQDTLHKRLRESAELLKENKKLGLK